MDKEKIISSGKADRNSELVFFFLISVISLSVLYNEHVEKGTTQKRKTVQEKSD